mmetsp:Transcript_25353/g.42463  ORF Transcript_25353/g.42463 Transcript_25353/m.42463 type:complete len:225 (-) Transcript_25353:482-1156(-)
MFALVLGAEDLVQLLTHSQECRPTRQLFQFTGANVCACGPDTPQYIRDGIRDGALVGQNHGLTLTGPVVGHSTRVFVHRHCRGHPIELLVQFSLNLHQLTTRFRVCCKHTSSHDEISTRTEGLREISRTRTTTIRNDVSSKPMCCIGAFENGTELGVPHACLLSGGAYRTWPDAHLDDVGSREQQFFHHLPRHHIARDQRLLGKLLASATYMLHEMLRITIRNI